MYGATFYNITITTNGLVTFDAPYTGSPNTAVPFGGILGSGDYLPAIMPLWTNLINEPNVLSTLQPGTSAPSNITWSVEGSAPNRQLIIRWSALQYYYMVLWANYGASFDLVLNEGDASSFEFRYYKIDPSTLNFATIGIRGDDGTYAVANSYTSIANYQVLSGPMVTNLQGATVVFNYTGQKASDASVCGLGSYSLASLTGADIIFNSTTTSYYYYYRPCGPALFPACHQSIVDATTSMCQVSYNLLNVYSLSNYNPSATHYSYLYSRSHQHHHHRPAGDHSRTDNTAQPSVVLVSRPSATSAI